MSNPQREHYERLHDPYAAHYYDRHSLEYRRRRIIRPLFQDADLNRLRVADVACGDGYNSLLLRELFPSVETVGFDISETACARYRELVRRPASAIDLLEPLPTEHHQAFDAVMVVGGLHHCVADLGAALGNIRLMLRPGGTLYAVEPNARFALNAARMLWYRRSKYFDEATEAPLLAEDIAARSGMNLVWTRYFGGPAYVLILNSLLFGLSPAVKAVLASPLLAVDRAYDHLPWRGLFPAFMARLT